MIGEISIIEKIEYSNQNRIIRYAWGNSVLKTWFITKSKNSPVPRGSKLLFIIEGEESNMPIFTADTYPKEGDIISDTDDLRIKITNVRWK